MTEPEMGHTSLPTTHVTAGVGDRTIRAWGLFDSGYGAVQGHLGRCGASAGSSSSPNVWAVRWTEMSSTFWTGLKRRY